MMFIELRNASSGDLQTVNIIDIVSFQDADAETKELHEFDKPVVEVLFRRQCAFNRDKDGHPLLRDRGFFYCEYKYLVSVIDGKGEMIRTSL